MRAAALTALALLAGVCLPATAATAGTAGIQANRAASAAIADTQAALRIITAASGLTANDPKPYHDAAHQASLLLDGGASAGQRQGGEQPAAAPGALGYLSQLRHYAGNQTWKPAVQAAWANELYASQSLHDAADADGTRAFLSHMTDALEALDVALGRDSAMGPLGGLEGAMATTDLGVPAGAATVPGCRAPTQAPAYGIASGYLMYVAVPAGNGAVALPQNIGVREVYVHDGIATLYTAASRLRPSLCPRAAERHASDPPDPASLPKLYTETQAHRGEAVYASHCSVCHGDHMQGKSAPTIAGSAFLKKAKLLGWSVDNMRTLIVTSMPASNPGSLSSQQYAAVIAYLLASDCYPAGKAPFPTQPTPTIEHASLAPPSGAKPTDATQGTCKLHGSASSK